MAQISFNIKDTKVTEAEEAVAALNGYRDQITNADGTLSPNPQTKAQFLKDQCKAWVRNQMVEYKNRQTITANQDTEI